MEGVVVMADASFWRGKKVLVTGHTGFKGSWLSLWLQQLGADVYGYALAPEPGTSLFHLADVESGMTSVYGDMNDYSALTAMMHQYQPDIVLHLAAQPLVRLSYDEPISTFATNVMGTVHILEAARRIDSVRVVLNVTSDKCYENPGLTVHAFQEDERMGGADPYSASKGCAELVTSSFVKSFYADSGKKLTSARAGNVIGGGDFAIDRIIPDLIRAVGADRPIVIRNPQAVRPWQHVLDCLYGYLMLAEQMWSGLLDHEHGWNFGPNEQSILSVSDLIERSKSYLDKEIAVLYETLPQPYEAKCLMLSSEKSRKQLGWQPKLHVDEAIEWTIAWYNQYFQQHDMRRVTLKQIECFMQKKEMYVNVNTAMPIVR